jgi:hypothetical protein
MYVCNTTFNRGMAFFVNPHRSKNVRSIGEEDEKKLLP